MHNQNDIRHTIMKKNNKTIRSSKSQHKVSKLQNLFSHLQSHQIQIHPTHGHGRASSQETNEKARDNVAKTIDKNDKGRV
jgi:hypothetical protein